MPRILLALALTLAAVPAFGRGGGGGGESAIGNDTTTSMGEPLGSPNFMAARSAAIAGTPAQQRALALGQNPALVARCASFHPQPGCHAPLP